MWIRRLMPGRSPKTTVHGRIFLHIMPNPLVGAQVVPRWANRRADMPTVGTLGIGRKEAATAASQAKALTLFPKERSTKTFASK